MLFTINHHDQWSIFTRFGPGSDRDARSKSIAWHGKKAELEKEGLTFAFALAYAAAHAGPKSGSSEEPT